MTDNIDLRNAVIKAGVSLLKDKLVMGTGGNISARTNNGFLITPSGMDYMALLPEDVVEMGLSGNIISGIRTPSIEKEMHRMIYLKRTDANAIVHVHSTYVTAVAASRSSLPAITDNQVAVFGGAVNLADYAPIGSTALAENVVNALDNGCGALLSNHGGLCIGRTLDEALFKCKMLEEFAKIFILAKSLGGGVALDDKEIIYESADLKKRYGQAQA